jgi:hypothetical protein
MQTAFSKSNHLSPQPELSLRPSSAHQKSAQNHLSNRKSQAVNITPKLGEYFPLPVTYIYSIQIFPHFGRIFTSRPTPKPRPIHPQSVSQTTPSLRLTNRPSFTTPTPQNPTSPKASLHPPSPPNQKSANPTLQTNHLSNSVSQKMLFLRPTNHPTLPTQPHRPLLTPSRASKRGVTPSSPTAGRAALLPLLCDTGEES